MFAVVLSLEGRHSSAPNSWSMRIELRSNSRCYASAVLYMVLVARPGAHQKTIVGVPCVWITHMAHRPFPFHPNTGAQMTDEGEIDYTRGRVIYMFHPRTGECRSYEGANDPSACRSFEADGFEYVYNEVVESTDDLPRHHEAGRAAYRVKKTEWERRNS